MNPFSDEQIKIFLDTFDGKDGVGGFIFNKESFGRFLDTIEALKVKLEAAEKEIANILDDNDVTMPPKKEYSLRLKFNIQKNDGPYVDKTKED